MLYGKVKINERIRIFMKLHILFIPASPIDKIPLNLKDEILNLANVVNNSSIQLEVYLPPLSIQK